MVNKEIIFFIIDSYYKRIAIKYYKIFERKNE